MVVFLTQELLKIFDSLHIPDEEKPGLGRGSEPHLVDEVEGVDSFLEGKGGEHDEKQLGLEV